MFESKWRPRGVWLSDAEVKDETNRERAASETREYLLPNGLTIKLHPACRRPPEYWDGYNDAKADKSFDPIYIGQTSYDAEEYRAGYLQACAEIAAGGER